MSHSMLTCRDQPSPMTTRVLLSQNEQGVEQVGISIEMQVSLASVAAAITHRCTLDKAFSELDTKARSEIENELKMLLIQIRTIISGYEPFIKLCANFNLSKELKDTIELIDESVKDISESTTRP
ncbi:hypothetical protein [Endozoicomonas sp. 8E]|uniref:hypothetical protein n=1 Tax=Endozoicomonas sp. 8E TaxID=3035692 RepID=UPI002938D821|nr:hypothetical protein [Endozoicomonas sp. 8E]WOG26638.1 hypothetical protein P6910_19115 [Endozoicomonas sp. 8E]